MTTVAAGGRAIRDLVLERGSATEEEIAELLDRLDIPPDERRFAALYPRGKRGWVIKEGDLYIPGPKVQPQSTQENRRNGHHETAEALEELPTLTGPGEQLESLARRIGIDPKKAASVAGYLETAIDAYDPRQLWNALQQCSEISPSQRKRLAHAWLTQTGVDVPPDILQALSIPEVPPGAPGPGSSSWWNYPGTPGQQQHRRYWVDTQGDIHPLPQGEDGLTYSEALQQQSSRLAAIQAQQTRPASADTGEPLRLLVEAQRRETETTASAYTQGMEAMQSRFEGLVERLEERHRADLERLETGHKHNLELLQVGNSREPSGFLEQLESALPGSREKLLNAFLHPPVRGDNAGVTVKLGDGGELSLDAYERFETLKMKRDGLNMAMNVIPDFIQAGKMAAESLLLDKQQNLSQSQPQPPASTSPDAQEERGATTPPRVDTNCTACGVAIAYRVGDEGFRCPSCQTLQWVSGEIMKPPAENTEETPEPSIPTPTSTSAPAPTPVPASPPPTLYPGYPDRGEPPRPPRRPELEPTPASKPPTEVRETGRRLRCADCAGEYGELETDGQVQGCPTCGVVATRVIS